MSRQCVFDPSRASVPDFATTMPRNLKFGLSFLACFALLTLAFEASRGTAFERFVVEKLILSPTAWVINSITPQEQVVLVDRSLVSAGRSRLHVTRGCEGVEMFLLLISAVIAFPASLKRRLQGLALGAALAYVLSIARLASLHYVLHYRPDTWESMHGLVLPLAPLVVMTLFYLRWSAGGATPSSPGATGHVA